MEESFAGFRTEIEKEYELKEEIKAIVREQEQKVRELLTTLQKIHKDPKPESVAALCNSSRNLFPGIQSGFSSLSSKVAPLEYFKYHDLYRFLLQRAVFGAAYLHYLEKEELLLTTECAAMLGLSTDPLKGLHLDLDDYLHGLLELAKELGKVNKLENVLESRLSVNAVVVGDFERPRKARDFLTELDAGFRSLNLKNDSLRRRFDGLKYDLKKVEEVVYDLSIRNLGPKAAQEPTSS